MWELCRTLTCPNSTLAIFAGGPANEVSQPRIHWTQALNGREWATVVLLAVVLTFIMARNDMRPNLLNVCRVALGKVILVPAAIMLTYLAAVVFAASRIDLWNTRLIGATLAWVVASALVGFFKVLEVPNDKHYFRSALKKAVAITILVDAYVNLFVFPFWAELIILPTIALVVMLQAVTATNDEVANIRGCLNGVAGFLGISLFVYATIRLIEYLLTAHLAHLAQLGRSLILPMWLNLALIPFTYLLALRLGYETAFMRLGFAPGATQMTLRRAKLALLLEIGPRAHALGEFGPPWPYRFSNASTLTAARQIARSLRVERATAAETGANKTTEA
jgi:hypothetical protein